MANPTGINQYTGKGGRERRGDASSAALQKLVARKALRSIDAGGKRKSQGLYNKLVRKANGR